MNKVSSVWTMEELRRVVLTPDKNNGFEVHLKHLWDNNNPKSIFMLTGLDVSRLMEGRKNTSGIQIIEPEISFKCSIE